MATEIPLVGEYTAREIEHEAMDGIFLEMHPHMFGEVLEYPYWSYASENACHARRQLKTRMGDRFRLNLGVYRGDEIVGWTTGTQMTSERYAMNNSAILPEHRGRGIYSALLRVVLKRVSEEGFQMVTSHHHPNNAAVLVPKLKAGFLISGFEINDRYGLLVALTYFFDPRRREVFEFRTGQGRPGEEVREALGL